MVKIWNYALYILILYILLLRPKVCFSENFFLKEKTLIEQLREIRDKISLDIKDLTTEQMKEYFSKQKTLHPTVWQKEGVGVSNEV